MAMRPGLEVISSFSSRIFTANTVLEKLSAKASSTAVEPFTPEK